MGICGAEVRPGLVSAGFTPHALDRHLWGPFVLQISVYESALRSSLTHSPAAGGVIRLRVCLQGTKGVSCSLSTIGALPRIGDATAATLEVRLLGLGPFSSVPPRSNHPVVRGLDLCPLDSVPRTSRLLALAANAFARRLPFPFQTTVRRHTFPYDKRPTPVIPTPTHNH